MTIDQLRALIPGGAGLSEEALADLYAQLRGLASAAVAGFLAEHEGRAGRRAAAHGSALDGANESPWPAEWGPFFDSVNARLGAGARPPRERTMSA